MPKMMDSSYTTQNSKDPKWDQYATRYKWRKGWQRLRLYGLVYTDARHNNIKTKSGKAYNEFCHGYDVDNDRFFADREDRCECCRLGLPIQVRYFVNVFDLDAWEKRPASPTPDWTPIYLADLPPSLMRSIVDLKPINGGHLPGDTLKGAIINVNFNPESASPAEMYKVSMDTKNWAFEPDMCAYTFAQELPDGKREVRKGTATLPAQWVYYPCRSSRDNMTNSLQRNGYYSKEAAEETNGAVVAKSKNLLSEINGIMETEDSTRAPKGGVAQLAKLREEPADQTPPPPRRTAELVAPAPVAPAPVVAPAAEADDLDIPF